MLSRQYAKASLSRGEADHPLDGFSHPSDSVDDHDPNIERTPTHSSVVDTAASRPALPAISPIDRSSRCYLIAHLLKLFDGGFGVVADCGLGLSPVPGI